MTKKTLVIAGLGSALAGTALAIAWRTHGFDWAAAAGTLVNENTPVAPFIIMMAVLPVLGFPLSVFLVIAGAKFGLYGGLALSAALYPVHLTASYILTRSVIKKRLLARLKQKGYESPTLAAKKAVWFGMAFMAAPGIPYAPKNYLLAMTNLSYPAYILISWPIHILTGLAFVLLGRSAASLDWRLALAGLAMLLLGYALTIRLKKRLKKNEPDQDARHDPT